MSRFLETSREESLRALRTLWRSPVFSLSVLALLIITIGTVTAGGAAAYELLRGRLPYGEVDRLMMVWSDLPKSGYVRAPLSGPEVIDIKTRSRSLADIAAISANNVTLEHPREPLMISAASVTPNFFDVVRAAPLYGRTFAPGDEGQGPSRVLVISWGLWQTHFGGDPKIIGRRIFYAGETREIIGVMPASFRMAFPPDANIPAATDAWAVMGWKGLESGRHQYFARVIARLRDGATEAAASAEVGQIGAAVEREFTGYAVSGRRFFVVGLARDLAAPVRVPAAAFLFIGIFLVVIAYANLAGLWIARAVSRRHEHGVQQALGASLWRVRSQLLLPTAFLSIAGIVFGLAAGQMGLGVLRLIRPPSLARLDHATLTLPVVLGVIAIVLVSTLFLAIVSQASVAPLADSGLFRTRVGAAPRAGARAALVIAQVALALVFLIGSALWTRSFINVLQTDLGFRPEGALTFKYAQPPGLRKDEEKTLFNRRMQEAIGTLPGVTAAATISHVPFDNRANRAMSYSAEGAPEGSGREADTRPVGPDFLRAAGARLHAGRFFTDADDLSAPPVVVVDRLLAERTWPGEDAIGKRISIVTSGGDKPEYMTVIGVLEHVRYRTIETQVREQIYLPVRQYVSGPYAFLVRTSGDLATLTAAIRERVAQVDRRVPVWDVRPLESYYDSAAAERRFTALLLVSFAGAAVALASIGIYGLLTYFVASRRGELGVRLALGAGRGQVARGVLREGIQLGVLGVVAGGLVLFPISARLGDTLYNVRPHDPLSWGGAAGSLILVVAVASWLPAFRASRTDPSSLMRSQ